ncbi:MAG: amidohydrolase family protein [Proteobacteria bacterium]|nr:amidohydrolase family protein [Pseudomonadota bacterium]
MSDFMGATVWPAILIAALGLAGDIGIAGADEIRLIDAHSQFDHKVDPKDIIRLMDEGGISRVILATRGKAKTSDLIAFAGRHPGRITPAVRTKGGIYRRNRPRYYKRLEKHLAMPGFGAMAEVILWHAEKGNPDRPKAPEVVVHPQDERVQVALGAAIERRWPFIVHIEFAAAGSDRDAFMAEFEALLTRHPDHPFALIHMGQLEAKDVRRLIETHKNIHFLTSHANPVVTGNSRQPWIDMFDDEALAPVWKDLMTQYPDRFILAFDNVWAYHWGTVYLRQIALWRQALAALPHEAAHAIAHGNAERLWRLPPAR